MVVLCACVFGEGVCETIPVHDPVCLRMVSKKWVGGMMSKAVVEKAAGMMTTREQRCVRVTT